jgi:hypothetical protein
VTLHIWKITPDFNRIKVTNYKEVLIMKKEHEMDFRFYDDMKFAEIKWELLIYSGGFKK